MPFGAQVYRVMIASPSDVDEARGIIRRAIESWNSANSLKSGIVLFPVGWETATAPALGTSAQDVINVQVGICDILIGVFWTRLGTPTRGSASGTVEEIERHVKEGKVVMLYFSNQPASPQTVDPDQFKSLQEAKQKYNKMGLTDTFDALGELEAKLVRGLTIHMNAIVPTGTSGSPTVATAPVATPALSTQARQLLAEAVKDRSGTVMRIAFLGGKMLQTNGRNFITSNDPREIAKWEEALGDLVDEGLLESVGYKNEVFKVTAEGYRIGDSL